VSPRLAPSTGGPRVIAGTRGAEGPVRVRIGAEVVEWRPGETLIETLMAHYYGRRGRGSFQGCRRGGCGACKLRLEEGVVALRRDHSRDVLAPEERACGLFLACRAYPLTDLAVRPVARRNLFFERYGRALARAESVSTSDRSSPGR